MSFAEGLARLKGKLESFEADGRFELQEIEGDVTLLVDKLKEHQADYPEPIFAVFRRLKPVMLMKDFALVLLHADVQDVLLRDDVFDVTYGPKMRIVTGGADFFLGMANSPEYERDVAHMRSVMRRSDLPGVIAPLITKTAAECVAAAKGGMEVVSQLTKVVPTRLVSEYFGCVSGDGGVSEVDAAAWASTVFQYLFTDLKNDPAVDVAARAASAHVRDWLDGLIAKEKAAPSGKDTVLNRCLTLQAAGLPGMADIDIRNNLLGLLVGAIPTTSKVCTQALDELLKRPDVLAKAREAALADDDATLAEYVFEALRFHPNNSGVFRIAAEDYVVGKGTLHATTIPKGMLVLAATQSAMNDATVVEDAHEFRIGRPGYVYMHFGMGLHTCFGQYINKVQVPGILKPLLKRQNLRRAEGDAGVLTYAGPFPASLSVAFD